MRRSTRSQALPALATLLAVLMAGCQTSRVSESRGPSPSDPVQEAVGVQELRQEVAELRNTVEVQRNELEKLRQRQSQLYDDLDKRLRQDGQGASGGQQVGYGQAQQPASSGQGGAPVSDARVEQGGAQAGGQAAAQGGQGSDQAAGQSGGDQVYGQQGISRDDSAEQQAGSAGTSQQQAAAAPRQQGGGRAEVASTAEQTAYDEAFELLKQSRYNDAIIEFQSVISQFPNGALVDDAQYWIGEAYYVTRDFESALNAFQAVVDQYPDSQRIPEAMLKLGYVQAELGRTAEARQTLNQVISDYPGSRVAISAETRLSKIR